VLIGIYTAWLAYLIMAKYRRTMLAPASLDNLWMCWPVSLTIFLSARHELLPLSQADIERDLGDPFKALVYAMPIAGFGLLLLSETAVWLFGYLGPRRRFASLRHPVMSVHAISLLFYISEPGAEACVMFDAFGRPLHPLRYVMWTISVSAMCFAIYLVVENLLKEGKQYEEQRSYKATPLRNRFIDSLLGCYGTFVLGFLGSSIRMEGTYVPNAVFFTASTASFYRMVWQLSEMLHIASNDPAVRRIGLSAQFVAIRIVVFIVWHSFPVVWLLGAFDLITVFGEHMGYCMCDICAKYLLLFVYVSHVNA